MPLNERMGEVLIKDLVDLFKEKLNVEKQL